MSQEPKKKKETKKKESRPLHLLVDERESGLYHKLLDKDLATTHPHLVVTKQVLLLGDMVLQEADAPTPYMILERKSLADLLASIKDGRYEEQSHRLTHASGVHPHNIGYVIEGVMTTLSATDRNLVYATMTSLNQFKGYSVFRTTSVQDTADFLVALAHKFHRNLGQGKVPRFPDPAASTGGAEAATTDDVVVQETPYCQVVKSVKKDNLTPENIGEVFLCQIPHISSVTAVALMREYRIIKALIDALHADPTCLKSFYVTGTKTKTGKRKISSLAIANLVKFLGGGPIDVIS